MNLIQVGGNEAQSQGLNTQVNVQQNPQNQMGPMMQQQQQGGNITNVNSMSSGTMSGNNNMFQGIGPSSQLSTPALTGITATPDLNQNGNENQNFNF